MWIKFKKIVHPEQRHTQRFVLVNWLLKNIDPQNSFIDLSIPDVTLFVFKTVKKNNNPDLSNYRETILNEHRKNFKKIIFVEIKILKKYGTWKNDLKNSLSPNTQIVSLI